MPFDAPIHTNEANLPRVLAAGLPVLLVFWQKACAPCDQLAPVLDRLARRHAGRALVVKVNAAEEPGLVRRYGISRLPGLVFLKDGQVSLAAAGAAPESELSAWLDHLAQGGTRPAAPTGPSVPVGGSKAGEAGRPAAETGSEADASRGASAAAPGRGGSDHPLILSDATFDQLVRSARVPVLVDFWAEWCAPCRMIAPAVAALARELAGRVVVAKLNVDENPRVAARFGVQSIPTLLIFRDGRVVDHIVGAQPAQVLRQRLLRQLG